MFVPPADAAKVALAFWRWSFWRARRALFFLAFGELFGGERDAERSLFLEIGVAGAEVCRACLQQILCILGEPCLLRNLLSARPDLTHLVEMNKAMNQEIALHKQNIRMPVDKHLSELCMIFTRYLWDLRWIFLHLRPARSKVILHGAAGLPHRSQ